MQKSKGGGDRSKGSSAAPLLPSEFRKALEAAGLSKDQSALEDDASLCVRRSLFGLWRRLRRLDR